MRAAVLLAVLVAVTGCGTAHGTGPACDAFAYYLGRAGSPEALAAANASDWATLAGQYRYALGDGAEWAMTDAADVLDRVRTSNSSARLLALDTVAYRCLATGWTAGRLAGSRG